MAENFVELGAEGINYITEKHWDRIHDTVGTVGGRFRKTRQSTLETKDLPSPIAENPPPPPEDPGPSKCCERKIKAKAKRTAYRVLKALSSRGIRRPFARPPEKGQRSPSLDRESQRSEQVIRALPSRSPRPSCSTRSSPPQERSQETPSRLQNVVRKRLRWRRRRLKSCARRV